MRVLRFIARQMRFLVDGSRTSAVATAQLRSEIENLRGDLAAIAARLADLDGAVDEMGRLSSRLDFLYAHADNVTEHLRQLSAQVTGLDSKVSSVADVEEAHRSDISAMRSALRLAVNDLGDRVTQLTVRLNEL